MSALGIDPKEYKPAPVDAAWRQVAGGYLPLVLMGARGGTFVIHFAYHRGFVDELALNAVAPVGCSFAEAFRHEPVHALFVLMGDGRDSRIWPRLTEPALRRIVRLGVQFHAGEGVVTRTAFLPLFDDPHLAGVRQFRLDSAAGSSTGLLHPEAVGVFARSPLAYRLDALDLGRIDDDGVRALCRDSRLQVSKVSLHGTFTRLAPTLLERAGHTATVSGLSLLSAELRDAGLDTLARGDWRNLTELDLPGCGITDAGLRHLAASSFTPHLEVLDLSSNPLCDGEVGDGLHELAAALNPGCLRLLNLTDTGLGGVPDFLATRFGDRVVT